MGYFWAGRCVGDSLSELILRTCWNRSGIHDGECCPDCRHDDGSRSFHVSLTGL